MTTVTARDSDAVSGSVPEDGTLPARRKLFIKTYGCQMNVYDSERMAEVLHPLGYEIGDTLDDADMVILNTCHIREKASEKVFSELGRIRPAQIAKSQSGGRMILAVAGCVAQAAGAELLRRAPHVDIVLGPQTYHRLPEMVARANRVGGGILDTDFPPESKFDHLAKARQSDGVTAFLSVQEGCDKFCTFCVVPYTRGAEFSRPVASVVQEARLLAANGVREITLLGQNVNAYHGAGSNEDDVSLAGLLRELAEIEGLERLRYTTSHPRDMDDDLIAAHRDLPQLMPYLHLPVQAGSDRILEAMNRNYTADQYRRVVDRLREARPDLALSSDFIVGFPGETDRDFAETMDLVREVTFAQAYSFKYSERPGTPAAGLEAQVDETVRRDRLAALQALLDDQQRDFNRATVGKTLPVLLEKPGRHDGQLVGRSPYLQPVHIAEPQAQIGQIVDVTIGSVQANSLAGTMISPSSGADA